MIEKRRKMMMMMVLVTCSCGGLQGNVLNLARLTGYEKTGLEECNMFPLKLFNKELLFKKLGVQIKIFFMTYILIYTNISFCFM